MPELILTNGDSAASLLGAAGKSGLILPWRDILHEGPIVAGALEDCSRRRAAFLASRFGLDEAEVARDFTGRDAALRSHKDFGRIELWFEHDLYDQLQLIQILAFLADESRTDGVVLVQADDFLGSQRSDTILRFESAARPAANADLDLAERVWADLAMPTPESVAAWLAEPDARLPFLAPALHRFLEELPAPKTGLGRSETTVLASLANGASSAGDLFRHLIANEEAAFMGDWSFFRLLDDLAFSATPLIAGPERPVDMERYPAAVFELTPAGERVLDGDDDRVAVTGIDRWWAGTRLTADAAWRFDREGAELLPPEG